MIAYLRSGLRRTLCLSLLTFVSVHSMAQETEEYSPDAPGATTGVGIMPQGKIDWETGIGLEWDKRNGEHARTFTINTSMFRIGLTPQAEVRLQIHECITHTPEGNFGALRMPLLVRKSRFMRAERCFQRFPLWVQYSFLVVVMHTICPRIWAFKPTSCSKMS